MFATYPNYNKMEKNIREIVTGRYDNLSNGKL